MPGSGHDRVHAGGGANIIEADDGTRDDIECGDGVDRAYLDVRPHEAADDWGNCDFINDERGKNIDFSYYQTWPAPRLRKTGSFRRSLLRKGRCVRAVLFLVLEIVAVLLGLAVVGVLYLLVRRWL